MQETVFESLQKQLQFCFEANRRATFKSWIFDDEVNCNAAKLAEAGFVFTGSRSEPDAVKCFLCNKSLDCWDEDDDPWKEHRKHSPNCSFARMDKPEESFTLSEFLDIRNELIEIVVRNALNEKMNKVLGEYDEISQLLKQIK